MKTIELIFEKLFFIIIGIYIGFCVFNYVVLPKVIERRSRQLGLMEYNAEKDKMIAKDSLQLNSWDIYYLQYGNTNGY